MSYQLEYINSRAGADPDGLVHECDERFSRSVSLAVDKITENLKNSPIVLMSGPSGSGKTTTAKMIVDSLNERGIIAHSVSLDNYFRSVDLKTSPRTQQGDLDFESPLCLDMELLNHHFNLLSEGKEILIPKFEFARQMRSVNLATPLKLDKNEIIIFEGIHALNDQIAGRHEEAEKVYISASSDINEGDEVCFKASWLRMVRRCVRDHKFRGSDAAFTLTLWENVRKGETLYILPFKEKANITLDSSLPYEVCVMKNFAEPLFSVIPADVPYHAEIQEIMTAFKKFKNINPNMVHRNSLLREFIGGSSFKY